ncbi:MAG TPA: AbrB/MazE/SpoVT family DNA-binding domain-containing protein [Cyclobacteriaceae bacterium]|nr:AbrB/MazE/SpoVT family DNA-binding domain-containing protein [Cyclobacteriaceae bacterium]
MSATITKIRRIGNSRGILFSKTILDKSGITDNVQIIVKDKTIIISAVNEKKKKKWSDFKRSKKDKSDFVVNKFDLTDWTWE